MRSVLAFLYCAGRGLALCSLLFVSNSYGQSQSREEAGLPENSDLKKQVSELRDLVQKLQERVDELEKRSSSAQPILPTSTASAATGSASSVAMPDPPAAQSASPAAGAPAPQGPSAEHNVSPAADLLRGTTVNISFDGYYAYNFNQPIGRANLLRSYDVSSNAISLNQAALVLENAADPENGKRVGMRLDLQYGQATETLQGNPANEPRPEIYRNVFQAYGEYVAPIGTGLKLDFGKFASSLGYEGNYTKDQMNYSRSFWFAILPFYHMGLRANYKVNDKLALSYWLVNGTQQVEPFNGFKDQFFGLALQPAKSLSWNVNYYLGQEHPDVMYFPNGGAPPGLPTQQGVPFMPITDSANGKLHIFDSYVAWQASSKATVAVEGDYVIQRLHETSSPMHVDGGAAYLQYQLNKKLWLAGRAEYVSDHGGGLFSNSTAAFKETTFTTKYALADQFLVFGEWRRDFSNQPYFYTSRLGILKKEQNTATLGLVWWFGGKQGVW